MPASVPEVLAAWLRPFQGYFTAAVWRHALVLVAGAVLAPGRRTVTAARRVMGLGQAPGFAARHRVLSHARWSSRAVAHRLLLLLVAALVPEGPVVVGLDDTIERRWGARIGARGIYRDPVRSLPGVGTIVLATLLTEAGDPLACRDHAALRTLSGVAPVTKRSGKTRIVVMRYAAQVRLRQAVFHWARVSIVHDPKSRSRYEALRARGHSYGRALRGVADRLLGVACVLLRRQVRFDPDHGNPAAA